MDNGKAFKKYIKEQQKETKPLLKQLNKYFDDKYVLFEMVRRKMEWDYKKTRLWFSLKNVNFGGISPDHLILMGRANKVKNFILNG